MGKRRMMPMVAEAAGEKCGKLTKEQHRKIARELLEHPIRTRILGWLSGQSEARTQREIGRAMCLSNAAVHYHLKLLESVGLVRFEGTRPGPNSITEKLYSANPKHWKDSAAMDDTDRSEFYLQYTLASIQEMHREGAELVKSDWKGNRFLVGCYEAYASEEEVKRLKNQLLRMLHDFHKAHKRPQKGSRPLAITLGLMPSKGGGWRGTQRVFDMLS